MKTKTVYIADDGKEFDNQGACKEHESLRDLRQTIQLFKNNWYGQKHEEAAGLARYLNVRFHIVKKSGQTLNQGDDNRS